MRSMPDCQNRARKQAGRRRSIVCHPVALLRRGIPEQALIAETQGSDTSQSAERVANIMRANGMRTCIAVSDAYHMFRIRALLEHQGVQVEIAPRPASRPHSLWERFVAVMREAASYLIWKLGVT